MKEPNILGAKEHQEKRLETAEQTSLTVSSSAARQPAKQKQFCYTSSSYFFPFHADIQIYLLVLPSPKKTRSGPATATTVSGQLGLLFSGLKLDDIPPPVGRILKFANLEFN